MISQIFSCSHPLSWTPATLPPLVTPRFSFIFCNNFLASAPVCNLYPRIHFSFIASSTIPSALTWFIFVVDLHCVVSVHRIHCRIKKTSKPPNTCWLPHSTASFPRPLPPPSHLPRSALRLPPTPRPSTFNSSALQTSSIFPSFATTDADSITLPPPPAPLLPFSSTRKCWLRRRRKQKALVKQEWHRTINIEVVSGERAMVAVLFALRAFAKQMLLLYQSLRCVSCLSVPSKMRSKGLSCLSLWLQFWFTWKSPCGF